MVEVTGMIAGLDSIKIEVWIYRKMCGEQRQISGWYGR
jgi:hypothetical protein